MARHSRRGDEDEPPPPPEARPALDEAMGPGTVVAALGPGARMVPLPEPLRRNGQRGFEGALGLDLVIAADQIVIVEGWARAQTEAVVRLEVRLVADPGHVARVRLCDARAEHGVHILVVEPQDQELLLRSVDARRSAPRRGVARAKKDATAVFLEVDESTIALLGRPSVDLLGHSTTEFVHPADVGRAIDAWMAVRAGEDGGRLRVRYRHADGHHLWVEVTNHNHLDDPERGYILSEMVDISAEMAPIEALRDREGLLARLTDALPIGVCHLRADLTVVYANEPLVALLGTADSIAALLRGVAETDRRPVEAAIQNAFLGIPARLEVGVIRRPDTQRCELTFRPMTTDGGMVDGVIVCATDVTAQCRLRAELEHRAWHDPLTGCLNRAAAVVAIERALREFEQVEVAYIDLDGFKAVNDQLSHAAGDELLRVAAGRLRRATRAGDQLARLGGDEFVVICRQSTGPSHGEALVDRLTEAIQGEVRVGGQKISLSASVGVALAREGELDPEAVLHRADVAMYTAKRRGRADAAERRRSAVAGGRVVTLRAVDQEGGALLDEVSQH